MQDYSQVLSQRGQQLQSPVIGQSITQQPSKRRNRSRGQQTSGQNRSQQQLSGQKNTTSNPQVFKKSATRALANTLGASAETARGLGIPKNVVHKIVNLAYGR